MALSLAEQIHPSAVVDADAELASDVQVGPYAIIEGAVYVGPGTVIEAHACLRGPMTLGGDILRRPRRRARQRAAA